ncbi:glycan-binding surface protein [Bacteroides sp. 1001136B_160425_E2]|uniref:glycan-binding surface protein n=1 Tax=Bacteroides sp. 1001136B_160425_E2 TaxID=2787083 RepID=UPI00189CD6D5|nr:glycan-binding surface protein [Bacteroides sp. 1001136B_160425_E2]
MKSIYKYLDTRLFLIGLLVLPFLVVVSCQNDDDDAIPVIHYIRVTDPAKADSTFTDVNPGTMIVVVGEHLGGTQKVYINDQEVSFNRNYVTSTNIILTVPAELELLGENPELKGELRVETNHGVALYNMHVLSPAPYITRIAATYPIEEGDELVLIGGNFYEVQGLYFSTEKPSDDGKRPVNIQKVVDYQVTNNYGRITLTVPANVIEEGYLVVECYTSSAVIEFKTTIPEPVLTGISSTMPVVGSMVTITGQNFIQVSNVNVNGEFDIPVADITVSDAFDELSFVLPQAPTHSGKISVTTGGGTGELSAVFYPVENVILNYDGIGSHVWGDCSFVVADGSSAPYVSTGTCLGITGTVSAYNYWWKQSYSNAQWVNTNVLPGNTPIGDLKLQFECFVKEVFTGPVFQIAMCENFDAALSGYVPVSSFTGKTETGKWMQCSVPLSSVVADATYQEFLNRNSAHIGVYATNPGGSEATIEVYFDNFRIVRK